MDIGKPKRRFTVEPVRDPVPQAQPVREPEPEPRPVQPQRAELAHQP
jgi:hypothetical protein